MESSRLSFIPAFYGQPLTFHAYPPVHIDFLNFCKKNLLFIALQTFVA